MTKVYGRGTFHAWLPRMLVSTGGKREWRYGHTCTGVFVHTRSLTRSLTHSLTLSLTHSVTHSVTPSLPPSLTMYERVRGCEVEGQLDEHLAPHEGEEPGGHSDWKGREGGGGGGGDEERVGRDEIVFWA